jgi:hypothetical protein
MCKAMQSINADFDEKKLPELEPCGISVIDEAVVEDAHDGDKSSEQ